MANHLDKTSLMIDSGVSPSHQSASNVLFRRDPGMSWRRPPGYRLWARRRRCSIGDIIRPVPSDPSARVGAGVNAPASPTGPGAAQAFDILRLLYHASLGYSCIVSTDVAGMAEREPLTLIVIVGSPFMTRRVVAAPALRHRHR
jgi:hypothetical protein